MTARKWGAISSGAEFESMVTTLVFFEDPGAVLLGRSGRDGGQDARSGDGTLVYQAKFHRDASATRAIADAKKEAEKIALYRQAGHALHAQWVGVTAWRLVTNAEFNDNNRQAWLRDVVPLFADQGLTADYWERATLDALLDRYSEVDRAYFGGETRVLLTMPEARERVRQEERFLPRAWDAQFRGRDAEIAAAQEFLRSDRLFLVAHGAGGTGRTRLMMEIAELVASEGGWQVLWANIESMASTGSWFQGIDPSRPTLLLVDEPRDESLLRVLAEQLGGRRTSAWKIAVAVRTPKDPVLRFLRAPELEARVQELPIRPLSQVDATAMCVELLQSGSAEHFTDARRAEVAGHLAERFHATPVWITLAIYLLDKGGDLADLPTTAQTIAGRYLGEVYASQPGVDPDAVRAVIRWAALLGVINRQEQAALKSIGAQIGIGDPDDVLGLLAGLVRSRALVERGANNRLVELKPDVLRDHVLQEWLTVKVSDEPPAFRPTGEAKDIGRQILAQVREKGLAPLGRAILGSFSRTEYLLRAAHREVPLLDSFLEGLDAESIQAMRAPERVAVADALTVVAEPRPLDTVRVTRAMQASVAPEVETKGLFRPRRIGQRDVIRSLAWPLFHAAMGAATPEEQRPVLQALLDLVKAEADDAEATGESLPNDGRRAAALIVRTLEGGPRFAASYDDVALELALELIGTLSREAPTPGVAAQIKAVVYYPAAVERRQTWADREGVHFHTMGITPEHPAWGLRERLLNAIRDLIVAPETPQASRIVLWKALVESHRSLTQVWMHLSEQERPPGYTEALLADLQWAERALKSHPTDVAELTAARALWYWHHQFDQTPALQEAAGRLEQLYAQNRLAGEFEPLLGRDDYRQRIPRMQEKGRELAVTTAAEINAFIDRAAQFMGEDRRVFDFAPTFNILGESAVKSAAAREYIFDALTSAELTARSELAAFSASAWLNAQRSLDPAAAVGLLDELLTRCGSNQQRVLLLIQAYSTGRPREAAAPSVAEREVVYAHEPLFLKQERTRWFIQILGHWVVLDWPATSETISRILSQADEKTVPVALVALAESVYFAVEAGPREQVPRELGTWLLDQIAKVPEFADVGSHLQWYLDEILKTTERPSVAWLATTIAERGQREQREHGQRFRALNGRERLSGFVAPLTGGEVAPEVGEAIRSLVGMLGEPGTVGYSMPAFLKEIDPRGVQVPAEIARKVSQQSSADELVQWARVAQEYGLGTAAWRSIAKPILALVPRLDDRSRVWIFSALGEPQSRFWMGGGNEVAPIFVVAVKEAKEGLEAERDEVFLPFWTWRLASAEAELRDQEQRIKEERGE